MNPLSSKAVVIDKVYNAASLGFNLKIFLKTIFLISYIYFWYNKHTKNQTKQIKPNNYSSCPQGGRAHSTLN